MSQTAASLGRLLDHPKDNPYSTLIALFLNAVDEAERLLGDMEMQMRDMVRAAPFFTRGGKPKSRYDSRVVLSTAAKDLMRDGDHYFKTYMQTHCFTTIEQLWGLQIKERHTIVEKSPMKLKARPGDPMAQKEFDLLQASMHTGSE
ncbi:hypothetical protein LTR35_018269, partial [Friedmanniomyces endolithicus]